MAINTNKYLRKDFKSLKMLIQFNLKSGVIFENNCQLNEHVFYYELNYSIII